MVCVVRDKPLEKILGGVGDFAACANYISGPLPLQDFFSGGGGVWGGGGGFKYPA